MVFVGDAEVDDALQLLLLDAFDLESLVFDALSDLATLLKIVEALLFLNLVIHTDLVADGRGMASESVMSLGLELAIFMFLLSLLLYDAEELVALSLGLLGKHHFAFDELAATGDIKLLRLLSSECGLLFLFTAELSFSLFEGTFSTKGINLTLSISGTLLKLTKTLNLLLLLLSNALCLPGIRLFLSYALSVVANNFQVFLSVLTHFFSLAIQGNLI